MMEIVSWCLVSAMVPSYLIFHAINRKLARTAMELVRVRRSRDRLLGTIVGIHRYAEPASMTWVIAESALRCEDPDDVDAAYEGWKAGAA